VIAAGPTLSLCLLDVPVVLSGKACAMERLEACYRALLATPHDDEATGDDPVRGTVTEEPGGALRVWVTGRPESRQGDVTASVRALNHELLHAVMLRRADLFFLHAGVVSVRDRAIVLPGLSQAGKSTLALALVMAGARFLTDELLAFDPATGRIQPFLRAPKVRDVCLPWFPEFGPHFVGEGEGRFLPLDVLGPDAVGAEVRPGLFVSPTFDAGADDTPTPLGHGAGLLRLTTSSLNFGSHRSRSIDHLSALATPAAHAEIRWSNPHRAAAAILDRCRRLPDLS
jgi:hypothetical protein